MDSHSHDVLQFLDRLGLPDGQFLEIRTISPDAGGAKQRFFRSITDAARHAQGTSGKANVYLSASPRCRREGTREAVAWVIAAWSDQDFHQIDPADRQRAERIAYERLDRFGRQPTILVHSGNGLQCWWLYENPFEISENYSADWFEAINRGIARALGGDNVHDLARVLRVPGTWNLPDARKRARGCAPVLAKLIYCDGPTYKLEDFSHLQTYQESTAPPRMRRHSGVAVPTHPDPDVVEAFRALLHQLRDDHLLVRTWVGDRALQDPSRSGWDMALTNQLRRAHVREEFVPHILRAFSRGRGPLATDDYIRRTIAKARKLSHAS